MCCTKCDAHGSGFCTGYFLPRFFTFREFLRVVLRKLGATWAGLANEQLLCRPVIVAWVLDSRKTPLKFWTCHTKHGPAITTKRFGYEPWSLRFGFTAALQNRNPRISEDEWKSESTRTFHQQYPSIEVSASGDFECPGYVVVLARRYPSSTKFTKHRASFSAVPATLTD